MEFRHPRVCRYVQIPSNQFASSILITERSHQIPARSDGGDWKVSSIRKILINRRYIAEIEINRENKGVSDLPETAAYRVVRAPYQPIISVELFEMAQAIRKEKSLGSPNRRGRPRGYSQTQCQRVYPLQGILVCGHCGHAMAPWYVRHRAGGHGGKKRKTDSFVNYYLCAKQQKNWKKCDHKNLVLARLPETWILDKIKYLATSEGVVKEAMEQAWTNAETDLRPSKDALALTNNALQQNQGQINTLIESISSGNAQDALWGLLNEKAAQLKLERERLLMEQRRLSEALTPLEEHFDAEVFHSILTNFMELAAEAEPDELQKLLRFTVRRIEWMPDNAHRLQLYHLAKPSCLPSANAGRQWFHTNVSNGSP